MANGDITYSNPGAESAHKAFASGIYEGLATADIAILCGFVPAKIVIHNDTDDTTYVWFKGMTQGQMFQYAAAGDKTLETVTGAPVPITSDASVLGESLYDGAAYFAPDGEGFYIPLGTTTVLNTTGDKVYWEAWR